MTTSDRPGGDVIQHSSSGLPPVYEEHAAPCEGGLDDHVASLALCNWGVGDVLYVDYFALVCKGCKAHRPQRYPLASATRVTPPECPACLPEWTPPEDVA